MRFLRKSLIRKLIFSTVVVAVLIAVLAFFLFYFEQKEVPYLYFVISLFVLLIIFSIIYWYDVVKPCQIVLEQMNALLAGRKYKKIFTNRIDEVGILANFFNQVIVGLGKASFDIKEKARMMDELTIASQLQREILPLETPPLPGMQIVAKNRPASEVGGDSFNILTVNGKTYIYIGDVTGHGVAAGLIMTMVNSLISVFSETYDNSLDIIINVNKHIKRHIKKAMFMTMVLLCWDHEQKKLSFVGAGHEHILVYRASTGQCDSILSGGVALGMVPDNSKLVKEKNIELDDGDFVILYTDGITEARNKAEQQYTLESLKTAVIDFCPQYGADGVNYHIAQDVSNFMIGHKQDDDMTLIVLKRDFSLKEGEGEKKQTTW